MAAADEEDHFEDAADTFSGKGQQVPLKVAVTETVCALELFMNNKFEDAKSLMQPHSETSMYHAHGFGTISFIQASMTFDPVDLERASRSIKSALSVCERHRKRHTGRTGRKQANDLTAEEMHAELCYAELLLQRSLLTFMQDDNLIAFIKGALKIRECYGSYKHCWRIFRKRDWLNEPLRLQSNSPPNHHRSRFSKRHSSSKSSESKRSSTGAAPASAAANTPASNENPNEEANDVKPTAVSDSELMRAHYESGVKLGIGVFNLLISMVPARVMKLLEFVGFRGDREFGLSLLREAATMRHGLRAPLAQLCLLVYNLVVTYAVGSSDADLDLASSLVDNGLRQYPNSALFLFLSGRLHQVRGSVDDAISQLYASIDSQSEWIQFHHLCYWELMWSYIFKCDWLMAMKMSEKLLNESHWSRAFFSYLKGALLLQLQRENERQNINSLNETETRNALDQLFADVPRSVQRIAGKSLPIEKFGMKRAKRYTDTKSLMLPGVELIVVWNAFPIVGQNPPMLQNLLELIDAELRILTTRAQADRGEHYWDDFCLGTLMKGICLAQQGHAHQAYYAFNEVLTHEKDLSADDKHLLPLAQLETALLYIKEKRYDEAETRLETAKSDYKGYLLESRIHFRIHNAACKLKRLCNKSSSSPSPKSSEWDSSDEDEKDTRGQEQPSNAAT